MFENVSVYLIFPKCKKAVSEQEELFDSEHRMTESTVVISVKVFIDTPQENIVSNSYQKLSLIANFHSCHGKQVLGRFCLK